MRSVSYRPALTHETSRFTRHVDLNTVLTFFHHREKRNVDNDFVDVRIGNRFFKADIKLRGDEVVVEYVAATLGTSVSYASSVPNCHLS